MTLSLNSIDMPHIEPDSPPVFADLTAGIEPFITEEELQSRVGELAYEIAQDYRNLGVTPESLSIWLGVLKGVVPFMADLMRAFPPDLAGEHGFPLDHALRPRHQAQWRRACHQGP